MHCLQRLVQTQGWCCHKVSAELRCPLQQSQNDKKKHGNGWEGARGATTSRPKRVRLAGLKGTVLRKLCLATESWRQKWENWHKENEISAINKWHML